MDSEDNSNWNYSPDQKIGKKGRKSKSVTWTASEYIDHQQTKGWFVLLAIVTAGLSTGVYFVTRDYFGTAVIVVLGIVVGVFASRTPRQLTYVLSDEGLKIEQKNYPLRLFKSFSIIEDGSLLSLYLTPVKRFMPPVSAYFSPQDHEAIMAVIEDRLPYEERRLEGIDRLTRRLRF